MNKVQISLLDSAKSAALYSYSPYSNFRVGAAVLGEDKIFIGANIENASYNLGICAERIALSMARMNGVRFIAGIAIYCLDAKADKSGKMNVKTCMPCGACRQWIEELCPEAWIVTNASNDVYFISELLPLPFTLKTRAREV